MNPNIPHHYSISQPGETTPAAEPFEDEPIIHGTDHTELDAREEVKIKYFYPETYPVINQNDALHKARHVSDEPHPDTTDGHIVTVAIKHGDCFRFKGYDGTWRFVGVSTTDPAKLFFAHMDDSDQSNRRDRAYKATYRSDFAHKLAGISNRSVRRIRPETAGTPSEHAKQTSKTPKKNTSSRKPYFQRLRNMFLNRQSKE